MVRRRSNSTRSKTQWEGVVFTGSTSTIAETFEVTTETLANEWGPFTILRIKAFLMAETALGADKASLFALGFRKVVLDRTSDTPADIGGTVLDATYLANDDIMHFGIYQLSVGQQTLRSDDLVVSSQRPRLATMLDIKAKRRFESANERLVIDLEQVETGASEDIDVTLAMRLLVMMH